MNVNEETQYDESKLFHDEIEPLLSRVHALCTEHDIPCVLFVQYGQEDNPDNNEETRCALSAMANMPGKRAVPTLHAVSRSFSEPHLAAALLMMMATHGNSRVEDCDAFDKAAAVAGDELTRISKAGHA